MCVKVLHVVIFVLILNMIDVEFRTCIPCQFLLHTNICLQEKWLDTGVNHLRKCKLSIIHTTEVLHAKHTNLSFVFSGSLDYLDMKPEDGQAVFWSPHVGSTASSAR